MSNVRGVGWGEGPWGSGPWGGADVAALVALQAVAVAENVVRVTFSHPVYFSGLNDLHDASRPALYSIAPVAGTSGFDGVAARPVSVVAVSSPTVSGVVQGAALDLTLDRSMTAYGAQYQVTISPLVSLVDLSLSLAQTTLTFAGLFRELVRPDSLTAQPASDMAMPNTLAAAVAAGLPDPAGALGTVPVDDSGDYATTSGLASLKERIFRRIFTRPGGFLHLGLGYGVGILDHLKKLALSSTQAKLTAAIESQVAQEPEVARVRARIQTLSTAGPNAWRVVLLVQMRSGGVQRVDVPVKATA